MIKSRRESGWWAAATENTEKKDADESEWGTGVQITRCQEEGRPRPLITRMHSHIQASRRGRSHRKKNRTSVMAAVWQEKRPNWGGTALEPCGIKRHVKSNKWVNIFTHSQHDVFVPLLSASLQELSYNSIILSIFIRDSGNQIRLYSTHLSLHIF